MSQPRKAATLFHPQGYFEKPLVQIPFDSDGYVEDKEPSWNSGKESALGGMGDIAYPWNEQVEPGLGRNYRWELNARHDWVWSRKPFSFNNLPIGRKDSKGDDGGADWGDNGGDNAGDDSDSDGDEGRGDVEGVEKKDSKGGNGDKVHKKKNSKGGDSSGDTGDEKSDEKKDSRVGDSDGDTGYEKNDDKNDSKGRESSMDKGDGQKAGQKAGKKKAGKMGKKKR